MNSIKYKDSESNNLYKTLCEQYCKYVHNDDGTDKDPSMLDQAKINDYYNVFMDLSEGGVLKKDKSTGFTAHFDIDFNINGIGNLTLLPQSVNRSISNKPFAEKVNDIIMFKSKNDHYIPEFSYYLYAENKDKKRWGNSNYVKYLEDIIQTVCPKAGGIK